MGATGLPQSLSYWCRPAPGTDEAVPQAFGAGWTNVPAIALAGLGLPGTCGGGGRSPGGGPHTGPPVGVSTLPGKTPALWGRPASPVPVSRGHCLEEVPSGEAREGEESAQRSCFAPGAHSLLFSPWGTDPDKLNLVDGGGMCSGTLEAQLPQSPCHKGHLPTWGWDPRCGSGCRRERHEELGQGTLTSTHPEKAWAPAAAPICSHQFWKPPSCILSVPFCFRPAGPWSATRAPAVAAMQLDSNWSLFFTYGGGALAAHVDVGESSQAGPHGPGHGHPQPHEDWTGLPLPF